MIENSLDNCLKKWPYHLPKGIIHGDLFPDNVIINEKRMSQLLGLKKINIFSTKAQINKLVKFKNISKSFYIY